MKILYTFLNFNSFTGSELYYYELAKEMAALGHDVTIASTCDGKIKTLAESKGIKCRSFMEINNFNDFDIIHASHSPVIESILKSTIKVPLIVTCHSEILDLEKIPDNKKIFHFIGIRKSIFHSLPEGKRSLIYNPVDSKRFNTSGTIDNDGPVFFPGTINYLRVGPLLDVIKTYINTYEIVCMGSNDYPDVKIEGVHYNQLSSTPEYMMKKSSLVAGIINGRTGIEAAFCGKPYLNYVVNKDGMIICRHLIEPSEYVIEFEGERLDKNYFTSEYVAKRIELLYRQYL